MQVRHVFSFIISILFCCSGRTQDTSAKSWLLIPDRVFDGEQFHAGWQVWIKKDRIVAAGPALVAPDARTVKLKGCTVLPGFIEGHSHLFLHPYNETSWNDQVLQESRAERLARATVHANRTLMAGFTTVRDLGTEGAQYDDAGLKQAIEKGIIPGPRMLVATRAIVATGSYGPKVLSVDHDSPVGAAEADGMDGLTREIRTQIGHGADFIKVYADYRWGPFRESRPTFTLEELKTAVNVAESSGRMVVAHATTAEGMRRAIEAGVITIEHGDEATREILSLMKEKNIALCPTLSATEAIEQYKGWKKGSEPEPATVKQKRAMFRMALEAGVPICMGGDVGVFSHGDNVREMELMHDYGMPVLDVLKSATSVNADVFRISDRVGRIKPGLLADLLVLEGNPVEDMRVLRQVKWVMKNGIIYENAYR